MPVSHHQKCRFKKVTGTSFVRRALPLSMFQPSYYKWSSYYILVIQSISLLSHFYSTLAHKSSSHESRSSLCLETSPLPKQQSHVQPHSKLHIVSNTDSKSSNAILKSRMLQAYAI